MTERQQNDLFDDVLRICRDPVINDTDCLERIGEIQLLLGTFLKQWALKLEHKIRDYTQQLTPGIRDILGTRDKPRY